MMLSVLEHFLIFSMLYYHVICNICDYPMMLQTQALRVRQEKEPYIRVNTRELNRKLCTSLSTLYTNT